MCLNVCKCSFTTCLHECKCVWLFFFLNVIGAVAQCLYKWGVGSAFHHMKIHIYINLRLSNHQLVRKTLTIPYLRTRNLRKSSLMWLWHVRIVSWWGAHKVILAGPSHKTNIQTHWYEPDDFSSTSPPCTPWLKQIQGNFFNWFRPKKF